MGSDTSQQQDFANNNKMLTMPPGGFGGLSNYPMPGGYGGGSTSMAPQPNFGSTMSGLGQQQGFPVMANPSPFGDQSFGRTPFGFPGQITEQLQMPQIRFGNFPTDPYRQAPQGGMPYGVQMAPATGVNRYTPVIQGPTAPAAPAAPSGGMSLSGGGK